MPCSTQRTRIYIEKIIHKNLWDYTSEVFIVIGGGFIRSSNLCFNVSSWSHLFRFFGWSLEFAQYQKCILIIVIITKLILSSVSGSSAAKGLLQHIMNNTMIEYNSLICLLFGRTSRICGQRAILRQTAVCMALSNALLMIVLSRMPSIHARRSIFLRISSMLFALRQLMVSR